MKSQESAKKVNLFVVKIDEWACDPAHVGVEYDR